MAQADSFNQVERHNSNATLKPLIGESPVILTVISNWLMGDRVLAFAGMHNYDFAYISHGKGTVRKAYLREAGLSDLRKEIVTILTTLESAYEILEDLKLEMHIEEPNAGIAFLRPAINKNKWEIGEAGPMENQEGNDFRAIYIVVKKGFAENVISAGERAGTRGATVIAGRGEAQEGKIPGLLIADDKEVIIVITDKARSIKLLHEIEDDTEIMVAGQARVYATEIIDSVGIHYF